MLSQRKLRDSFLSSLKRFLSTSGGITHCPPTLSTRVTFQARPRSTRIALRCTCVWTLDVKETKGYLKYIDSLGGQSQSLFVRMGRVAKTETLSKTKSPDVQKPWSTLWQGIRGLSPQSKPPCSLVLNSRLRGYSQIQSTYERIYLMIGQLRLNLNTCGELNP